MSEKKFGVGGKKFSHSFKKLCVLSHRYLYPRKTLAFSRKDICVAKPVEFGLFTLQLAVVHTTPYVHHGAVHRVLF